MRSRNEIMKMCGYEKVGWNSNLAAQLEVLLDIRDLLAAQKEDRDKLFFDHLALHEKH